MNSIQELRRLTIELNNVFKTLDPSLPHYEDTERTIKDLKSLIGDLHCDQKSFDKAQNLLPKYYLDKDMYLSSYGKINSNNECDAWFEYTDHRLNGIGTHRCISVEDLFIFLGGKNEACKHDKSLLEYA